jgi:hypothetical protein
VLTVRPRYILQSKTAGVPQLVFEVFTAEKAFYKANVHCKMRRSFHEVTASKARMKRFSLGAN